MVQTFGAPVCRQLDDAALRGNGYELAHTHFHGLFHHPVHFVAAGDALYQNGSHRQFDLCVNMVARTGPGAFSLYVKGGGVVSSTTVKKNDVAAIAQSQHTHGVMGYGFRQLETLPGCQGEGAMKAGLIHVQNSGKGRANDTFRPGFRSATGRPGLQW